MSNLFKSINVICKDSEVRVIDNNAFISQKILNYNEMLACSAVVEEDNFIEGIDAKSIDFVEIPEEPSIQAENIIADATMQADKIIEKALKDAEKIKKDAFENGKREAYEIALKEANVEIEKQMHDMDLRRQQMEQEYTQRLSEMEPILVDALLEVFNRVTHVLTEDKKELILYLVNSVMTKTESSRSFIIRVAKEDYAFLLESRDKIHGAIVKDVTIEIVEDISMKRNQCIIETDAGIYDCSLDIQLENLIREIKTLACMLD